MKDDEIRALIADCDSITVPIGDAWHEHSASCRNAAPILGRDVLALREALRGAIGLSGVNAPDGRTWRRVAFKVLEDAK